MPLLYAIVTFFLFGSSTGIEYEEICYGKTYNLPFRYTPPIFKGQLHFTPNNGGSSKLLMKNGEAKDPRIKVSIGKVSFTDVKEKYGGTFSISFADEGLYDVVILTVLDCSEHVVKYYGSDWYHDAPEQPELLDFTPDNDMDQSKVLWNRTNPLSNEGGRGTMKRDFWEMLHVTQSDSGFYNFRKQDGTVLKRVHLVVEEYQTQHDVTVNDRLFIKYPVTSESWTLTFTSMDYNHTMTLMKAGNLAKEEWYLRHRLRRFNAWFDGLEIDPVEIADSGTFEFIDSQGNLAMTVQVVVNDGFVPTYVYVGITVGIILVVIVCCCCVKKCCCKKSSAKREGSAPQTAAAPAVYYHDENQPAVFYAVSTTNDSHQPVVSPAPATTSPGPSVYNPVNVQVNPHQPEVVASGGQGVTPAPSDGSGFLSSDPGPRFELKGMSFPSAPPLSADTSHLSDVYNSDKLNFL